MRFRIAYTLTFLSKLPAGFQIPLQIEQGDITFEILEMNADDNQASAFVEGPVNRDGLQVRTGPEPLDGGQPRQGIDVPERAAFSHALSVFANVISFLTDIPIRYSRKLGGDRLIAETEEDNRLLNSFGTKQIHVSTRASVSVRSFSLPQVSPSALRLLSAKEVGLALYAQALLMQEPVAVFREFWKILESAFGAQNNQLIRHLVDFEPARQLDFTIDELNRLLVLRGRASHAVSRSGIKELRYVAAETSRALPRLKSLVEQVILTKRKWGIPTLETKRIAEIEQFIDSNGNPVFIRHVGTP
jgi:hypothetical protein